MKARLTILILTTSFGLRAQELLLKPDRVFDGEKMTSGVVVAVSGGVITYVGAEKGFKATADVEIINLPGQTLLPGLIEGHSHILLHPYNETTWNDQVLVESEAERVARATVHLRKS